MKRLANISKKIIESKKENAKIRGQVVSFQTKLAQAGEMLIGLCKHFSRIPVLAVMDSCFG